MTSRAIDCRALAFLLWVLAGCGQGGARSAFVPVPVQELERVTTAFDVDLESFKYFQLDEALPKFVALIHRVHELGPVGKVDARLALMQETARQGRVDLLEAFDARLGRGPEDYALRRLLHAVLSEDWRDERMIDVRDRLARVHSESLSLARYRPGGVEFLFSVLEDRKRSILDRVDSVNGLLGVPWSADVVTRLRALENDTTEVPGIRSLGPVDAIPTLGKYVRRAINHIELRAPK